MGAALSATLLGVGLYTEAFEGTIYLLRLAIKDHKEHGSAVVSSVRDFVLDSRTNAGKTIDECKNALLSAAVLSEEDVSFLHQARATRNKIVHDALRRLFLGPDLPEVREDIERLISIAMKIEDWQRLTWAPTPPDKARIAIAFSGLLDSSLRVSLALAKRQLGNRAAAR